MTPRQIQDGRGAVDKSIGHTGSRRNRLVLRDHLRSVGIGAFEAEKGKPQRVLFNVAVTLEDGASDQDDDVDHVLSYDMIVEAIEEVLADGRSDLLETVAERIAGVLFRHVRVMVVEIRVENFIGSRVGSASKSFAAAVPQRLLYRRRPVGPFRSRRRSFSFRTTYCVRTCSLHGSSPFVR